MSSEALHILARISPYLASAPFKTLLLFVAVGITRTLANRMVRGWTTATLEERRRWLVGTRNTAFILLLFGTVAIWAQELQSLLISIVAIAAALVLATKELIMCVSGGLMRTSTAAFHLGDRIEINGYRGDVIDHSILATTILEVGPGNSSHQMTGRTVVLPNSVFLSHPLINETFTDDYVLHTFVVAIDRRSDWRAHESALLDSSVRVCSEFIDKARIFLERQASRRSIEPLNVDPRVTLRLNDPQRIDFLIRVPSPTRKKGRIEQSILHQYLEMIDHLPIPERRDRH